MKRISIPTIIKNLEFTDIQKPKKKKTEVPPSVIVFQHNNLIEARYSLTLQEKKIILWLTSKIQPKDQDFKKHTLTVQEFMDLVGLTGHANYKELQKITLGLMKKVLVIKEPDKKRITQVSWINSARYEEGEGFIRISFAPEMHPFLLQLKSQFTAINATDIMQFKSIHAIRVYELLKQYQSIGKRTLSLDEIKEHCGIKDKLKKFSDFEKKILLISQREINAKSDIHFEFERIKHSRKIVAINFTITKNKNYELKNKPKQLEEIKRKPPLYYQLEEFGLSKGIIGTLIKDNKSQTIENAIRCVEIQGTRTLVRNPKAMLLTAIKEEWDPDKYKIK
jgi:plasmid replication initiation protein